MTKQKSRKESAIFKRLDELHDYITLAYDELDVLAPSQNNLTSAKRHLRAAHRAFSEIDPSRRQMIPARKVSSEVALTPREERAAASLAKAEGRDQ